MGLLISLLYAAYHKPKQRLLCVGHVCLDMINTCITYPDEDSKVMSSVGTGNRCIAQRWSRGGNAGNTCTILVHLLSGLACSEYDVECLTTFNHGLLSQFILDDFAKFGILTDNVVGHKHIGDIPPCSCVIINATNGTRTIIHSNQNLPELTTQDFEQLNLIDYSWIHFEGRNIFEVKKMIKRVQWYNVHVEPDDKITISVEVEKVKPGIDELLSLGDYVFISKEYATSRGYHNMRSAVHKLYSSCKPSAVLICPWGDEGAAAIYQGDNVVESAAFIPPEGVVDTLGAGDTFIAGVIYAIRCRKLPVKEAITFACQLAGAKCGMHGLEIRDMISKLVPVN